MQTMILPVTRKMSIKLATIIVTFEELFPDCFASLFENGIFFVDSMSLEGGEFVEPAGPVVMGENSWKKIICSH